MSITCYCCSGKFFEVCCKPFIEGKHKPATAELLMRSRYSAYATVAVDYIIRTTHVSQRAYYTKRSIQEWAESSSWEKLEILSVVEGGIDDRIGFVEFKAYYSDKNKKPFIHHEYSSFKKESGSWYFVEGKVS